MTVKNHVLAMCLAALVPFTSPAYSFETVLPDFVGDQAGFGFMRSRITKAMLAGPNFAEHHTLLTVGCGTECAIGFVANNKTGAVFDFPFGGEENSQMQLEYSLEANTVLVAFRNSSTDDGGQDFCVAKRLRFQDGAFVEEQSKQRVKIDFFCPSASALFAAD